MFNFHRFILLCVYTFMYIYLSEFARMWPLKLLLEHGHTIVAAQNAGGLPSRPAFPSSPGAVLTVVG